ncbi:MAG TPA: hypothetical protein VFA29_05680 [Candidatus Baltobacteraceae bacterium]|nr:hypothetical protein [Candidatus Baltobacteraceae bacterium]
MAPPDRPSSNALTGVFTSGSPPLVESLRTLAVTPKRSVTPGETIRAEFAFSNLGGAPATNVRVRFAVPPGVTHVQGADLVDDAPLRDEQLDAIAGAHLGDLPPNAQRRVACSFRVNDRIEDGAELVFQAALATDQTPVVASNAERLVVRSEPVLTSAATTLSITAGEEITPGSTIVVRAAIANTGASSAHDVMAFLPLPPHTRYVPRTARIAGRVLLKVEDEPFDYTTATVVSESLGPGQTVTVEYQATIDSPLADGTRLRVVGAVSSREVAEFPLESEEIVVSSPPDFSNDETALTMLSDDVVSPGTRVPINVRVHNSGTGDAHNVSIVFQLPPGLAYTPGSAHLDGQPVSDEAFAGSAFSLGSVPSGRTAEVGISAIVTAVGDRLPVGATLLWRSAAGAPTQSQRKFGRTLQVRVSSRFTRARNYIDVDRAVVQAREDVSFAVHIFNDGTAPATDVRLRIIPGAFLDDIRVAETADEPIPYREPFALGLVQPHAERVFFVRARVAAPVPDRSVVTLAAVLEFENGSYDVGTASVAVRSRPYVTASSCAWERDRRDPIRPGQTHEVAIRFTNDGSDVLRDARMDLALPADLVLERTQNARHEGDAALLFGDVPAETTHEARVAVRLIRAPRGDRTLLVEGTLSGRGISPVRFEPLEIQSFAQPMFAAGGELRSNPTQYVNAGERVTYELYLRNSGDGPAEQLAVRAVPSNLAVYVPASTTLNGMTIPDDLGASQLWSQRGLLLTDVNPGVELRARWEMLVISPLTAGTSIDTRIVLEWDGNESLALAAPPLLVESAPSLAAGVTGTPISLARLGAVPPPPAPETIVPPPPEIAPEPEPPQAAPAVEAEPQAQEPAFAPEPFAHEPFVPEAHEAPAQAQGHQAAYEPQQEAPLARVQTLEPALYADLSETQLAQTIRMLEKAGAPGLLPHIFAIRALLPTAIAGASAQTAQSIENSVHAFRAPLDRFFVRVRVPRLTVTAKDLEDRDSRFALRALVDAVLEAPAVPLSERTGGAVRLSGQADVEALRSRAPDLQTAPLGSAAPWIAGAYLLGTAVEYDGGGRSDALGRYREELLKVLAVLETLPLQEFHRVLASSVNRTLDDALAGVIDALRTAAHVAAE